MFDKCYSFNKDALVKCKTRYLWVLDKQCDYSDFDFTWEPAPWESKFRHAFRSQWQKDSGTYLIPKNGYTETKYNKEQTVKRLANFDNWNNTDLDFDYSWHPDPTEPAFIYQFGTQWQKTGGPVYTVPGATEVKYESAPRITKTTVDDKWTKPTGDFENFDYTWHPDSTEQPYIYQFGTQHQKTGGPKYTVPGAVNTKFVGDITSKVRAVASGAILIKHLNTDYNVEGIDIVATTRFISNYLDTLKRILRKVDAEYVWVISDLCDYTNFDFSWHPALWQNTMLHVFHSNEQKFGDTFFVHVPSFLETAKDLKILEYYTPLNFVDTRVKRRPPRAVKFDTDSVVDAIWEHEFQEPVVQFYKYEVVEPVTISLWQERLRTVVPLVRGSENVLIPKDAKNYINEQVYDYEWIDKKHVPIEPELCDVIFISNGESMAEKHWQILQNICPRAKRVDGVDGRDLAYKTAARLSNTDWFYAVFAKTEVLDTFKFDFVADRLQEPKHYIFYSRNALNGLEYGSMNIDLYNKQLVLDTHIEDGGMLDFTLSKKHTVVPEVASIAQFNTDPWVTWRSAFREVIKLKQEVDNGAGIEIRHRLDTWCKRAEGENAEFCLAGANDALEFYHSVDADPDELQKSFHWDWIKEWYFNKYGVKIWT